MVRQAHHDISLRGMSPYNCIIILGPTASGKTKLAAELAYKLEAEIINADSRQVYKELNIGSGKDLSEYLINGKQIPYHLIDITNLNTHFHLYNYVTHFIEVFNKLISEKKIPLICGGTGLYLDTILKKHQYVSVPVNEIQRAELQKLDMEDLLKYFHQSKTDYHEHADISTKKRLIRAIEIAAYLSENNLTATNFPELNPLIIGIDISREERRKKIGERLKTRLKEGLIDEVKTLLNSGIPAERLMFLGLEYNYVTQYITAKISYDQMYLQLETAIHQFAKRQMTWFRKMEREGFKINWVKNIDDALRLL